MQITSLSPRRSPNPLDLFVRRTASNAINVYQKYISPRKGFSCAYRVFHCSESCSQYTKRIVSELGISQALPLIQQRFQACKAANQALKAPSLCHSTRQRVAASVPLANALQDNPISLVGQPWMAIGDEPLGNEPLRDEPIEAPDENSAPSEEQPKQRRMGGGSFRTPSAKGESSTTEDSSPNNNCPDWGCDSLQCASFGCDAIDCSSANFSGMDCAGADCSSLDCGSLDCGSCDVGSCDCSS